MANSQSLLLKPQTWNRALYFYIELKYQSLNFLKQNYSKEILKNKSKIIDKMLLTIKKDKFLFDKLKEAEEQQDILQKSKQLLKIETTRNNLINCGNKNILHKLHCKKCKEEGKESLLLEEKQKRVSCTIGYCKKPNCVKTRYAITTKRLYQTFFKFLNKKGKRVWRKIKANDDVMHCSISVEPIYIKDVRITKKKLLKEINHLISVLNKGSPCPNGFRSYMKTITNTFIDEKEKEHKTSYKLKFYKTIDKKGKEKEILVFNPLNLRGIKVFDIKYHHLLSKIRPHYHLAIIPNNKKDFIPIALIQYIRKQIFRRSQIKLKTHLQFHLGDKKNRKQNLGYKPAKSVLTYMTKRAIGVFGKSDKYSEEDLENKKIETIFEDKGTYGYQDFVSVEDYMKYFHNQKTISYFGKEIKKYTCNDMTFIESHLPLKCAYCGELNKDQIEYSRSEELIAPPPPEQHNLSQYEDVSIIVKYHNPLTAERFEGSMYEIRRRLLLKDIEKQEAIVLKEFESLGIRIILKNIQNEVDLGIKELEDRDIKNFKFFDNSKILKLLDQAQEQSELNKKC